MEIAALSVLAAVGLWYWLRTARALSPRPPALPEFGFGDAILAAMLAGLFIYIASQSVGRKVTVTAEAISGSMAIYGMLVVLIVGFLIGRNRNPATLFGLAPADPHGVARNAAIALAAALPVVYFIHAVSLKAFGGGTGDQAIVEFLHSADSWSDRALLVVMAVIAAPVAEETIFRGYLHGVLRQYGGVWCGIGINALIFSAMHGHAEALAGLFVLGAAFSIVYERTRSLWAPILMHAGFNAITVIMAFVWPKAPL